MFEIRDRAAAGRIGRLTTPHGTVTTPTLLPVINPNLNRVTPTEMRQRFGTQMVITNAYIIRKRAALRDRALRHGVHALLEWDGPVMTDSGTFQAYVYGDVDVTAEEILEFQKAIGVDVGTLLDVFTVPEADRATAEREMLETVARAEAAAQAKDGMLLAATVQGGRFPELREEAARRLGRLAADVHPIGGVVPLMEQGRYAELTRVILAAKRGLPAGRPVHLFGAGHPLVYPLAVALGCDLFDSSSYAKYAKDSRLIFPWGTRSVTDLEELPCACAACAQWSDAKDLARAEAAAREDAITHHNLHVSFAEIRRVRQAVRDGDLWELVEERAAQNPALQDALAVLRSPDALAQLERSEPISAGRALQWRGAHTMSRPAVARLHGRLLERWRPSADTCVLLPERAKPYSVSYEAYLRSLLACDAVVETPFGPVPLELDLVWPVAQSVMPQELGAEARRVRDAYAEVFFRKFEGCNVHPFVPAEHPVADATAAVMDAFDARRVRATARYQFGLAAGDALTAGALTFRRSRTNRRVRNVLAGGVHVASVRAGDGLLSLRAEGAQRILAATAPPAHRLVLEEDAVPFVAQGKNAMAVGVAAADADLRPGDECLLVDGADGLVAVGRMHLAGWEVVQVRRGPVARTRRREEEGREG